MIMRRAPGTTMLTAMRSAVEALAPAMALELAMDTPRLHTADGAELDKIMKNRATVLPGRRIGTADEIAEVILMLITNAYVTGEVVGVNGGGRFV
jgi:NAD(P)-dependent dehydrogenase (short-subunit alcohol dehydrogenase family)